MTRTKTIDLDSVRISSWIEPTAEDIASLKRLTEEQQRELLRREVQKGIDSGVSGKTMDDVWNETLRRMKRKAHTPDVL